MYLFGISPKKSNLYYKIMGVIEKMSEIIDVSPKKTVNSSEKIVFDIEKIVPDIEKIATETEKTSEIIPEKIRYRGQRGMDKAPRRYNKNSLRNLKQFKNTIPQKPDSNNWKWIVGIVIAVVIAIIIWRIYVWWKEKQKEKDEN